MIIREIIMWLSIMRSNLKDFPEIGSDNKIKALSEALVIIHKYEKIEQIIAHYRENVRDKVTNENIEKILEVVDNGNDD